MAKPKTQYKIFSVSFNPRTKDVLIDCSLKWSRMKIANREEVADALKVFIEEIDANYNHEISDDTLIEIYSKNWKEEEGEVW